MDISGHQRDASATAAKNNLWTLAEGASFSHFYAKRRSSVMASIFFAHNFLIYDTFLQSSKEHTATLAGRTSFLYRPSAERLERPFLFIFYCKYNAINWCAKVSKVISPFAICGTLTYSMVCCVRYLNLCGEIKMAHFSSTFMQESI